MYCVCNVIEHPLPNIATYETMVPKTQNRTPTANIATYKKMIPKTANPNAKVGRIVNHASDQKAGYSAKFIESRSSAQSLAYSKHNL